MHPQPPDLLFLFYELLSLFQLLVLQPSVLQERSEILRAAVKEATPEGFLCGPPNSVVSAKPEAGKV
eukprot:1136280-Pelagomonas_calceolata.AAC.5